VISNKMVKTVVVKIERLKKNQKYGKYFKTSRNLMAHVENAKDYVLGDEVLLEETRPMSKEKHWRVIQLITRDRGEEPAELQEEQETKEP